MPARAQPSQGSRARQSGVGKVSAVANEGMNPFAWTHRADWYGCVDGTVLRTLVLRTVSTPSRWLLKVVEAEVCVDTLPAQKGGPVPASISSTEMHRDH